MCALLQVLRSEPSLQAQLERSTELKASVDRGNLYVSGFLAETVYANMALLSQFSSFT